MVEPCSELTCACRLRYITPPGQGFLPRETAVHHQVTVHIAALETASCRNTVTAAIAADAEATSLQEHVVDLVQKALAEAGVQAGEISCIAYTKVWLPLT